MSLGGDHILTEVRCARAFRKIREYAHVVSVYMYSVF